MLKPNQRRHLREALRPPQGYSLDYAIGTTFSLDLFTLLTAPVAFTFFDLTDAEEGEETEAASHLELFETMRRYARRIAVFCQAGRTYLPKKPHQLFAYLESSVIEVTAPQQHRVFHPKLWVLRYTAPTGPVRYRVLCMSRNLTFDRSWDTVLELDGELRDSLPSTNNDALADFIAALPGQATAPAPQHVSEFIALIVSEIRRVHFTRPEGFTRLVFWPIGIDRRTSWPFTGHIDRMLVISPFLTDSCLARLRGSSRSHFLISRDLSLRQLRPESVRSYQNVYVLNPATEPEEGDDSEPRAQDINMLQGLHAKVYVADAGTEGRIWTGSANATDAAFGGNIEFLVELQGPRNFCGVDATLGRKSTTQELTDRNPSLLDLLQEYTPPSEVEPGDIVAQALERLVDEVRITLATAGLSAQVQTTDDNRYRINLVLSKAHLALPPQTVIICWPITLTSAHATTVNPHSACIAQLGPLTVEGITSFIAFEVTVSQGKHTLRQAFVLNLPLLGAPDDRHDHLLRNLLRDQRQVLRFLLLLLADDHPDIREALRALDAGQGASSDSTSHIPGIPLFEVMLRTLARNPAKLDNVAQVIAELRKVQNSNELLPKEFDAIWQPIWTARQRRQG